MASILAFSGSARHGSFNQSLVTIAAAGAREAGADVTLINLRDFAIPLYNADVEAASGMPTDARKLKALIDHADGLLIASPEYNSSYTPLLKNVIDWTSRPHGDEDDRLLAWKNLSAAIMAASPSGYGGQRSLTALRTLLENIDVQVLASEVTVPSAHEKFSDEGALDDAELDQAARDLGKSLAAALA